MDMDNLDVHVAAALQGVTVPVPFDVDLFCRGLSAARGRSIVLVPVYTRQIHRDLCLPWFTADDTDYVLFEQDSATPRRVRRALHAVGHLLLEHRGTPMPTERLAAEAAPGVDVVRLRKVLGDSVFVVGPKAEAEADAFAWQVLHRGGIDDMGRPAAGRGTSVARES
jgi:hypothetical protein